MMFKKAVIVAATLFVAGSPACFMAGSPAWAQDKSMNRTVDQYTCREIVRESGPNRDVAIAFLHGFVLGKSGGQAFNLDTLASQSEAFLEACLDNPKEKAIDAMLKIKK